MHKAILIMLLGTMSGSSMAEWIALGSSDSVTAYVDPSTIRKAGGKVKMWNLMNYTTLQREAAGSPYDNGLSYMSS